MLHITDWWGRVGDREGQREVGEGEWETEERGGRDREGQREGWETERESGRDREREGAERVRG